MAKSFEEHLAASGTVRRIDGSNLYNRRSSSSLWYWNHAESFRASALVLWQAYGAADRTLTGEALGLGDGHQFSASLPRVFALLCGQSIELLLKAAAKALDLKVLTHHRLNELRKHIGVEVNEHQSALLDALTEYVYWHGRYPTTKEEKTDEDTRQSWRKAFEKLNKIRNETGSLLNYNIQTMDINKDNYELLWNSLAPYFWTAYEKTPESMTIEAVELEWEIEAVERE